MTSGREEHETVVPELDAAVGFQRDLYLYWREAHAAGGLALTGRGYLTRQALRHMRAALVAADGVSLAEMGSTESEAGRLFFLRRLLERLALLRPQPGEARLLAEDRPAIAGFVALPLAERLRICARVWVAGGWWPDRSDPRVAPPRLMLPAPPRIALARRRLLESLATLASGAAVAMLATPLMSPATPQRAARAKRGSQPRPIAAAVPEGDIQRAALDGPLTWMGFVAASQAGENEGVPPGYRVCPAARALGSSVARLDESHGQVRLLPDRTIVAYPPLTAPELLLLDTCAEHSSLDQTARYRLSRQAFARARGAGWTAQTTADRLEALAGMPLPSNVRVTLDDWERHGERLRVTHDVRLLEVRDARLLDALLAEQGVARWVERRLTSTAALLAPDGVTPVRAWLLQRGELPELVRRS
jgi:hypothetical protein